MALAIPRGHRIFSKKGLQPANGKFFTSTK
jgi:hypothetical protein